MNPQEHHTHESTLYGYQLLEVAGKHTTWTTYKATEETTDKQVFVQVFDDAVTQNPQLVEALEDYAFQASRLSHVNLQQVLDFKNGQEGCILVKEYVEGTRLDLYLQQKKGLNWQHVLRFLRHMLHGMGAAHEAGFMHCVPTPQNVLIARGNTAKLMDMGVQVIIRKHSLLSDEKRNDDTFEAYLAPEAEKDDLIIPDASSDIYSLGLLGYEMLSGKSPQGHSESNYFVEENLSTAIAKPMHRRNFGVPEQLSEIIQKATEHHAIHRFNSVASMLEALDELTPKTAQPNVIYHKRVQRKRQRVRVSPALLLILGGLIALLGAGYYYKPVLLNQQNPFEALDPAAMQANEQPVRTAGPLNEAAAAVPVTTEPDDSLTGETLPAADTLAVPEPPNESPSTNSPVVASADTLEDTSPENINLEVATPGDTRINQLEAVETETRAQEEERVEQAASTPAVIAAENVAENVVENVAEPAQEDIQQFDEASLPIESAVTTTDDSIRRTLILTSEPGGAMVAIEGKAMGTTPFQLSNINSKNVDLVLSLPGHKSIRQQIELADDRTTELFFDLLPENRPLILTVFPWGNVYLDGELVAERVSGTDTLLIAPENYTLSIEHPSFGVWEQTLERHAPSPLHFNVDFTARAAYRISAFDEERQAVAGEVYIDGHNTRRTTPITIELPLGEHTIEVRAEGFEPIEITRHIERGNAAPEPIKLQLRRK